MSYADIRNFHRAYNALSGTPEDVATIQREYLDKGTPGLDEFVERFGLTAENLLQSIRKHPAYYASLNDLETRLRNEEAGIYEALRRLQPFNPVDLSPTIYYLIGGLRAGGNGGEGNYVLIGAEVFARRADSDLTEFSAASRLFFPGRIKHIVAHEVAHVFQEALQGDAYAAIYTDSDRGTLLAYALREGGADFIASWASGGHINPAAHEYGNRHEAQLWSLFRQQKDSTELGDWFFYAPKEHPDWPKDLGYWMGFKITEAYFQNAPNSQTALRDILTETDFARFLERSRYAEKFHDN